jgi:hypothetical protein
MNDDDPKPASKNGYFPALFPDAVTDDYDPVATLVSWHGWPGWLFCVALWLVLEAIFGLL